MEGSKKVGRGRATRKTKANAPLEAPTKTVEKPTKTVKRKRLSKPKKNEDEELEV
ncbi:hypothetical protein COLO4_03957 [Corchorus olitorius]|uniref:Uncharacterized protein n=1 Tax=Corchorus olitorius TaxID=93759 RepID=A0A1R3KVT8_9ROSI|nr:hypothetical protein COLO4_03957 [Corchorus olitorius]